MFRTHARAGEPDPLSIWQPVYLGIDEHRHAIHVGLAERNLLTGGEPGAGKSVGLNLIVAHAALSLDCRLILIDGKQVELGLWRACAEAFIGPSITDAIDLLKQLQTLMDTRYAELLNTGRRKITRESGQPVVLVVFDELAYFSATIGESKQQKSSSPWSATWSPAAGPPGSSSSPPPNGPPQTSSPRHYGTCSGIGGRFAAPPTPVPTSSSATAGLARATPPPTSIPPPGVWGG